MQSIEDKLIADLQETYYVESGLVEMLGNMAEFSTEESLSKDCRNTSRKPTRRTVGGGLRSARRPAGRPGEPGV